MGWQFWLDLSTVGFTFLVSTDAEACAFTREVELGEGVTYEEVGTAAVAFMFSVGPFHGRVVFGVSA